MATFTPHVYVEELPTLPPSVAEATTAIPAFIGYTEKAVKVYEDLTKAVEGSEDLTKKPTRISSLVEYENMFGGPEVTEFTVNVDEHGTITEVITTPLQYLMYHSLKLFFKNGGGSCYIVSLGDFSKKPDKSDFIDALEALKREDEPTLIALTDAVQLKESDYYAVCQLALQQCGEEKERFVIFDVLSSDPDAKKFRDGIGTDHLKYGAAYYPYLQTTFNFNYIDDSVTVASVSENAAAGEEEAEKETSLPPVSGKLGDDAIKYGRTDLYNRIRIELDKRRVILPPGAAIAGVYARVDREKGIWKAPANVTLESVLGPTIKLNNAEQEALYFDPASGKTINAIRSFTGQGPLILGARTLAGNDRHWRYIWVRRLFNMIEEYLQKATEFAVYEPNDAMTWLKVRVVVENYLEKLWSQGALAGKTSEEAFFVSVGLGTTMVQQDILEGRLIVEVGIAPIRPADFIILRFAQRLQEVPLRTA